MNHAGRPGPSVAENYQSSLLLYAFQSTMSGCSRLSLNTLRTFVPFRPDGSVLELCLEGTESPLWLDPKGRKDQGCDEEA